jgi:hypothetical protein
MVIWLLHLQVKICLLQVWMICLLQSLVPPLLKVVCLQVWMVIWLHLIQQAN